MTLANAFLDKDVFVHVEDVRRLRSRGWQPRSQICEGCKRRAWGPGSGEAIWSEWREGRERDQTRRMGKWSVDGGGIDGTGGGGEQVRGAKGKGKAVRGHSTAQSAAHTVPHSQASLDLEEHGASPPTPTSRPDKIFVFSCRHVFHQNCLETATREAGVGTDGITDHGIDGHGAAFKCPICVE